MLELKMQCVSDWKLETVLCETGVIMKLRHKMIIILNFGLIIKQCTRTYTRTSSSGIIGLLGTFCYYVLGYLFHYWVMFLLSRISTIIICHQNERSKPLCIASPSAAER